MFGVVCTDVLSEGMMLMSIQRIPSLKRWLLELWLDLQSCIHAKTYDTGGEISEFEMLVVLLEDRRYFRHYGVDLRSVVRVVILELANRRRGGASTIEMQFVRTVTQRFERTLGRKIREAIVARLLAFHLKKLEVLRSYLAIAYFGRKTHGAEAASYRIFGRRIDELTLEQAAIIAAMLVYPAPGDLPNLSWEKKVTRRATYGLRLLAKRKER
jgi:membrane peptidoglycan carboxypeptidase